MEITINLSTTDFTIADKSLIKECLDLHTNEELAEALKKLTKTAFMEYLKMFKEKGLPTRADEVQQERLFFLLTYYYQDKLPSENELSSIFQLTPSQSKTLLRNTKSRYRTKISEFIRNTLIQTLATATRADDDDDPFEFVCTSSSTVEELNLIVSQKGPTLEPIKKIVGLANKFSCAVDTYNLLIRELE